MKFSQSRSNFKLAENNIWYVLNICQIKLIFRLVYNNKVMEFVGRI